jgi:uncharacterized protein (TIGR03067 family)
MGSTLLASAVGKRRRLRLPVGRVALGLALLTLAVACVCFAGGRPKGDAIRAEMAKLAGTWQLISGENDGGKAPEESARKHKFVLTAEGTYVTKSGDQTLGEGAYVLDLGRTPKAVDFRADTGLLAGQMLHSIYRLDGDELAFCFCVTGTDRPTEFAAGAGSRHVLMVYKREATK